MIHPKTTLKFINDQVGYGVFATEFIPEGTVVYVKDKWEITLSKSEYLTLSKEIQDIFEKYSYIDENGCRIISWDIAKYVNHCCYPNTISTGYGFEIAIRDILPDEEITDEYGIFNLVHEIELLCDKPDCRNVVRAEDFDQYFRYWDEKIKKSLAKFYMVNQPLLSLIDRQTLKSLNLFFKEESKYKSVYSLKYIDLDARNNNSRKMHLEQQGKEI